jgi:hypothetical protein
MYCTTCYELSIRTPYHSNLNTYVISIRILYERQGIVGDLVDKLYPLVLRSMVNAPLQDTASVAVCSNFNTIGRHRIVYELRNVVFVSDANVHEHTLTHLIVLRCEFVETFLDDMIPIQVLDERHNMETKSKNDRMNLSTIGLANLNGDRPITQKTYLPPSR